MGFFEFLDRVFNGKKYTYQPTNPIPLMPLNAHGWRLIVDASNLAHKGNTPSLDALVEVVELLLFRFEGATLHLIGDANLPHQLGEDQMRRALNALSSQIELEFVHGQAADLKILACAKAHSKSIVVSNDWFGKGEEVEARLHVPRLMVNIQGGKYVLGKQVVVFEHEDRLQRKRMHPIGRYLKDHH